MAQTYARRGVRALLRMGLVFLMMVAIGLAAAPAYGNDAVRVTVLTTAGDSIEGTLKGATPLEISIEVAGQVISIPTANVKYISFVGRLDQMTSSGESKPDPLEDAFKAFDEIISATRVGILRDQYAAKLQATLPRVLIFTDIPGEAWSDVKEAMRAATAEYQQPLGEINGFYNPWSGASWDWNYAQQWIAYARELAKQGDENHRESSTKKDLAVGEDVVGRLGFGDQFLPETLGKSAFSTAASAYADVYRLNLTQPSTVRIKVDSEPCGPWVVLADITGKVITKDRERFGTAALVSKTLKQPGEYEVWVSCSHYGQHERVGRYRLNATVTKLK